MTGGSTIEYIASPVGNPPATCSGGDFKSFRAMAAVFFSITAMFASMALATPEILPVFPEEGETVTVEDFFLIVNILESEEGESVLDWEKGILVKMDGKKVPVEVFGGALRWMPDAAWADRSRVEGNHTVTVELRDKEGQAVGKHKWGFSVHGKADDRDAHRSPQAIAQSGRAYGEARQYTLGDSTRWEFVTGATYRGRAKKILWGAEVLTGNLEDELSQARHIYQASLGHADWGSVKLGDTRPHWDELIVTGQRLRGVEANTQCIFAGRKATLGLDFGMGQARRAVQPTRVLRQSGDSAWTSGTYARDIWAVRPHFAWRDFLDVGFTLLCGRDDTTSLAPIDAMNTIEGNDTLTLAPNPPSDNVVVGSDVCIRFFRSRFELFAAGALSLLTRNTLGGTLPDSVLMLPINAEQASGLIVLNTSTTPLSPSPTGLRNSAMLQTGVRLHNRFAGLENSAECRFELRGPNYQSMGNALLGSPRQGIRVMDRMSLFRNRLTIDGDYSFFTDRFDKQETTPTHTQSLGAQTRIAIGPGIPSLSVGYRRNISSNEDEAFALKNGINSIQGNLNHQQRLAGQRIRIQIFSNWAGVDNQWNTSTYHADSGGYITDDTSMAFSTTMYGFNSVLDLQALPLQISGGLRSSQGIQQFDQAYTGNAGLRYQILPARLSASVGAEVRHTRLPDLPEPIDPVDLDYGIHLTPAKGHRGIFEGSIADVGLNADIMNRLRYEWRF